MDAIDKAYETKRFVVLEAPVGFGKSACAIAVAKKYGDCHMITSQKILQDQYTRDFNDIFVMKGKSNYWCNEKDVQCGVVDCSPGSCFCNEELVKSKDFKLSDSELRTLGAPISGDGKVYFKEDRDTYSLDADNKHYNIDGCIYSANRVASKIAQITLHNFHSFLYQGIMGETHEARNLLIIDEAHNIESIVMDFFAINLNNKLFRSIPFPQFYDCNKIVDYFNKDDYSGPIKELEQTYPVSLGDNPPTRLSYLKLMRAVCVRNRDYSEAKNYEHFLSLIS